MSTAPSAIQKRARTHSGLDPVFGDYPLAATAKAIEATMLRSRPPARPSGHPNSPTV